MKIQPVKQEIVHQQFTILNATYLEETPHGVILSADFNMVDCSQAINTFTNTLMDILDEDLAWRIMDRVRDTVKKELLLDSLSNMLVVPNSRELAR